MAMADDGGRSRLGRGLAALIGDVGDGERSPRSRAAASARFLRRSCARTRAIRGRRSSTAELDKPRRLDPRQGGHRPAHPRCEPTEHGRAAY